MEEFTKDVAYDMLLSLMGILLDEQLSKQDLIELSQDGEMKGLYVGYCLGKGVPFETFNRVLSNDKALNDIIEECYNDQQ